MQELSPLIRFTIFKRVQVLFITFHTINTGDMVLKRIKEKRSEKKKKWPKKFPRANKPMVIV